MERAKGYSVIAVFMLLPFGFLSYGIIHEGQHLTLVLVSAVVLAAVARNNWISAFFWYLCAWMVFICLYRMIFPMADVVFMAALDRFVYLLCGLAVFVGVSRQRIKNEVFYNAICIAALVQCAIAISQFNGFDPVVWVLNQFTTANPLLSATALTGTLGNNNFLAAFIAVSLPFFFRRGWAYCIPLLLFCLYFANTSSAFVPAIIGALFYFWPRLNRKVKAGCVVAGIVIGGLYALFQHSNVFLNPRWQDWLHALSLVLANPFSLVFGMGPGAGWGKSYPLHNEWLQCLYQFGVVGFGLMAGYVLTIYRGNRILFTAFLIAAINMFGNYSLHLAPSAFLIILIAGLIERERIVRNG